MSRSFVETLLGAVVLIVALVFVAYAYTVSDIRDPGGYVLRAKFDRIDGINVGADVRISGITVGRVLSHNLDTRTFRAEVAFSVRHGIELPADSSAAIFSESLLGGRYIALQPGADDDVLRPGDELMFTQSAINLEELVGRFVFSGDGGN
ncbi:MAG: outer membrane lipid asymmetry maintenance protein MlaD [Geminicoccaceae bacterium]|nr:MAG: outer membrane lipid asymmetry maintenance protein MlaD [Geminicoccaceae bacterium]